MNKIKKRLSTLLLLGIVGLSSPNLTYSQDNQNKKWNSSNLNFYFEKLDNSIESWLSHLPKEEKKGSIWFDYIDTDGDGFYDKVWIQKNSPPIKTIETFEYNLETKKLDYELIVRDFKTEEEIAKEKYDDISQNEAKYLGSGFVQKINEFVKVQKNFNRFNTEGLENLVRKEYYYKIKLVNGKLVGNSENFIHKLLSEEEIKKIEDHYDPVKIAQRKEEAEKERIRLEKERKERQERIRKEMEMKKLSKTELGAEVGSGLMRTINTLWRFDEKKMGLLFEMNPELRIINSRNRGIATGLNFWLSNSKFNVNYHSYGENEEYLGGTRYQITKIDTKIVQTIKNNSGSELNLQYISPALKVSIKFGISRRKIFESDESQIETYIKEWGHSIESTREYLSEQKNFEYKKGAFYDGLGIEIYPFLKKENFQKNLSFSAEILNISNNSYRGYARNQVAIKIGMKYLLKKEDFLKLHQRFENISTQ